MITFNDYLFRINITHTFQCTFCKTDTETLLHLFVDCKHVQEIWHKIEHWIYDTCGFFLNFNKCELLFGRNHCKSFALNMIVLLVKQYIYTKRYKQKMLSFENIKTHIVNYYTTEKYIYSINGKLDLFMNRWMICRGLFINP